MGSSESRTSRQNAADLHRRRVVKCRMVIEGVGFVQFRAGHHQLCLQEVHPAYLDCHLAAAYSDSTLHAGALLTTPSSEQQIRASWSDASWSHLLVHLVAVQNIVCHRVDVSRSEHDAHGDIAAVDLAASGNADAIRTGFLPVVRAFE